MQLCPHGSGVLHETTGKITQFQTFISQQSRSSLIWDCFSSYGDQCANKLIASDNVAKLGAFHQRDQADCLKFAQG